MKKILTFTLGLAAVLFLFASCAKEIDTGTVSYSINSYGTVSVDDIDAWTAINNLYESEIGSISGIRKESKKFILEGKYEKCDASVLNACKAAEGKAASYTLKEGFRISVIALYSDSGETKNIYEHRFGN